MAAKSGSDFNSHYDGSTGSDGETRSSESMKECGPWKPWSDKSDGARFRTNVAEDHTLMAHGDATSKTRDEDHIHFYTNKSTGDKCAKDKETGTVYVSEQLGNAVHNFMGW
jgi:hypothetical protein